MNRYLIIALLVGLALRLPGWFSADEKSRFRLFEPDEAQHVDIALNRYQQLSTDSIDHVYTEIFNARGYGIFTGQIAWGWRQISGQIPNLGGVILLNRQVSTLFGLLLILVVFVLAKNAGLSSVHAGLAAGLLACCDLNITYSHYGIPAVGYVLGVYLAILGAFRYRAQKGWGYLFMVIGATMAFAFKFDFIPALGSLVFLGWDWWTDAAKKAGLPRAAKRLPWQQSGVAVFAFLPCLLLSFLLLTGFSWSWEEIANAFAVLRSENENVVASDQHWLENPLVYLAAMVAGIGLPVFTLAVFGTVRYLTTANKWRPEVILFGSILLLELVVRWRLDTPFVRRANVFMPAICLAAAYGLYRLRISYKGYRPAGIILAYTLFFALVGQSNHWWDTREAARDWSIRFLPERANVMVTPYVAVKGLPDYPRFAADADWDYAILHESYYQRYTLSMTTPFGYPECCAEVYHCGGVSECEAIQGVVSGRNDEEGELLAAFTTRTWFPERALYKQLFGSYETFTGDVLIYRKTKAVVD